MTIAEIVDRNVRSGSGQLVHRRNRSIRKGGALRELKHESPRVRLEEGFFEKGRQNLIRLDIDPHSPVERRAPVEDVTHQRPA
ncbi:MAG: hypothetical protein AAGA56_16025 [Myxococcota bacterium]